MGSNAEILNRRTHKYGAASMLLTSRDAALWMPRLLGFIDRQVFLAASLMMLAAVVRVLAFWWQGWTESPSLQAAYARMVAVSAGLIAMHRISLFPRKYHKIDRRLTHSFALISRDAQAIHIAERLNGEAERGINPFGILSCRRLVGVQVR